MRRLIGLEWNEEEARVVVASGRKGGVVFEQALRLPLREEPSGSGPMPPSWPDAKTIGQKLAPLASQARLGRAEVVIALGRSNIELRQLRLPPAPDEELPSLVRFQAFREFNAFDENWLLDFVPIDESADQSRRVLAAAIGPELLAQVQQVCATAGWKLRRLGLRACGLASLVARVRPCGVYQGRLVVELLGQQADLTVIGDRKVLFLRTARLIGDPLRDSEAASDLVMQLRRTIAAVTNQLEGRQVNSILLCGTGGEYQALAHQLDDQLGIPTEVFHPFEGLEVGPELAEQMPADPGPYAPLVGMVWDELEGVVPPIDFLHPRRPPQPPSPKRQFLLLAAAALVALLAFFGYRIYSQHQLASQLEHLRRQSQNLDLALQQAERQQKLYAEIARWKQTDVHWLEELRRLNEQFPPAKQAMVMQLLMGPARTGGLIQLTGLAASAADIDTIVERLRDANHSVVVVHRAEKPSQQRYGWEFKIHLSVPHQ